MTETSVVTLNRHIVEQERNLPEATGRFTSILLDISLAAKMVSREVTQAGLVDILGRTGDVNAFGEQVQKLDVYADRVIYNALDHAGTLCCMASEEHEELLTIPDHFPKGEYVLLFDPLDGSSNIDVNVSIGTIFSIHKRVTDGDGTDGTVDDCLQPGRRQLAGGYILYGSSTMLVYSTGAGVHGFTLDPSIGEFLLSHPNIQIPKPGKRVYSVNEGNYAGWSPGQRAFVDHLRGDDGSTPFSSRYIGSMVADVHRTLLHGGLFMYPADSRNTSGKLRLLYEANPMGFLVEQAGGRASTGRGDILDEVPSGLQQRVPVYMGSKELVDQAEEFLDRHD